MFCAVDDVGALFWIGLQLHMRRRCSRRSQFSIENGHRKSSAEVTNIVSANEFFETRPVLPAGMLPKARTFPFPVRYIVKCLWLCFLSDTSS